MKLAHIVSIALLASCQAVSQSFQVMNASNGPIPPVTEDLTISMGDHELYSLKALLSRVVDSSGIEAVVEMDDVRSRLFHSGVAFRGDFTIPAYEVWTVTEHALLQEGFFLAPLYMGETKMIGIHLTDRSSSLGREVESFEVDVEDLDYLAAHPGFLFSLTLELPDTDVGQVGTGKWNRRYHGVKLRCTAVDKNTVLLKGLGVAVEEVAREFLKSDELNRSRALEERRPL